MYAYIVNNQVQQTFDTLPASFANVSGLPFLTRTERQSVGVYDVTDTRPALPSSWHFYANERVEFTNGVAKLVADVVKTDDAQIRATLKERVNALRDQKLAGGVTYNGVLFDSDERSLANITATVAAISAGVPLPANFTWRSSDNQNVPMTAQQVVMLGATALAFGNALYQASWAHKQAIDAAQDPSGYDITTNW